MTCGIAGRGSRTSTDGAAAYGGAGSPACAVPVRGRAGRPAAGRRKSAALPRGRCRAASARVSRLGAVHQIRLVGREAQPLVDGQRGLVVRVDVEHGGGQALRGEVPQADGGERTAEAAALGAGADAEDVDLAESLLGVDLRPVEADELGPLLARALREEEALRVEPRFGLAVVEVALGEGALLGVVGEGL